MDKLRYKLISWGVSRYGNEYLKEHLEPLNGKMVPFVVKPPVYQRASTKIEFSPIDYGGYCTLITDKPDGIYVECTPTSVGESYLPSLVGENETGLQLKPYGIAKTRRDESGESTKHVLDIVAVYLEYDHTEVLCK